MDTVTQHKADNRQGLSPSAVTGQNAKSIFIKFASWTTEHNLPFIVTSVGMIVMLLWAGSYKMTAAGAEGIIPLVSNSPIMSWEFRLFGPYVGSDLIGITEIAAALLLMTGYWKPKAGIAGGVIAMGMFFTTSSMLATTPGATTLIHGIRYMSFIGLFLFKDVIAFGVALYLISFFGMRAIALEKTGF